MPSAEGRPQILALLGSPEMHFLVRALLGGQCDVWDTSPQELSDALRDRTPDLLLLDLELQGVSGLELVCRLRRDPLYTELPIVGMGQGSEGRLPSVALVAGCTGFIPYPLDPNRFPQEVRAYLEGARQELDLHEHLHHLRYFNDILVEKLEQRLERLEQKTRALETERERRDALTFQVLTSMARLLEAKDPYTRGHSVRVTRYAMALASHLGLGGEDLRVLERAGLLHDLGKISVDLSHIHKPAPLTAEEWALIRQHPETGYTILSGIDFLQDEALVVRYHHVHFKDYADLPQVPRRIRMLASIVTLADSYDAMTTQRAYNALRSREEAIEELKRCSGNQFDPELVASFAELTELERVTQGTTPEG